MNTLKTFGQHSIESLITILSSMRENGGHTFGLQNATGYLVGITKGTYPNVFKKDADAIMPLYDFYKTQSALDYPTNAVMGVWWDEDEELWVMDVVVLVENQWDAILLGSQHNQKEVAILNNGTFKGTLNVDKYIRVALKAVRDANETSGKLTNDHIDFIPHKSRLSQDQHNPQRPRNTFIYNIFVSPEDEFSFTIWSKADGHVVGDKNPSYADFMYLGKENALKLAGQIFRSLGYNPLNVLPEESI